MWVIWIGVVVRLSKGIVQPGLVPAHPESVQVAEDEVLDGWERLSLRELVLVDGDCGLSGGNTACYGHHLLLDVFLASHEFEFKL